MAVEPSKLRLVRCPKCENLLPELPDYSVYQCGGCGAVLRAKKSNLEAGNGSQRSIEERVGVISEKSESNSGKTEKFLGKGAVSGVENDEVRVSNNGEGSNEVVENFGSDSKREVVAWEVENGDSSKNEMGNGNLESRVDKLETLNENVNGVRRSNRVIERKSSDIGAAERFGRARRDYFEGKRSSSSNHLGDSSKYQLDSSYRNEASRATRTTELIEHDREELLRKLDELKDQLSRVNNANEKFHEKPPLAPLEPRMTHVEPYAEPVDCFRDHPSNFHRTSRQFSSPNKPAAGLPYFEHYQEQFPVTHNYNSMHNSNHVPRYEDSYEPQMFRRPPPQRIPSHHQYMGPELDPFEPHPYGMAVNHHSCSCYRCYDRQLQASLQVPPSAFANRRFPHVANKSMSCQREAQGAFGLHGYNSRIVDPQPHPRWPGDVNVEMGSFSRGRPHRMVLASSHRCRPVVGGAPFVTCHNCFEVLKLPKKVFSKKDDWQMSCGACSTVISFTVTDEKLVPVDTAVKQTTTDAFDKSDGFGLGPHGHKVSFCSEDYANSVYDFQAMDREPISSSTCQGVSSSKSEEMHNLHSVSATTSEDEHFSDELVAKKGVTSATIHPEKAASSPSPPGSPLQDPFDYTSKFRAINRYGKGNLSSRSDQERVITNKNTVRQNSLKESLATEMEMSHNEYLNNEVTQESTDKCREEDHPKMKKGVDSFLAGIIKKSFSKSNQTLESGKRNVMVNGNLIPDKLVKKAEKMAGPIYPGQYWYDYRAGFWGVMGGPCLGIIPPFIEEFNYQMPENCAAGNTGVFVNGRELHQKDMELLTIRGLPALRDKSYIIEISGRVVDEDSGQELDSLGKLAPT
uniref:Zinc-ribbon domain-containing protein n=2 Tax=Chenopodium quinoa TaxID=63459 RepID=A0A803M4W5_CHEQI